MTRHIFSRQDIDRISRIVFFPRKGLGDTLLMTPLFRLIKKNYSKWETVFFCRDRHVDLLRNTPYLDNIIGYQPKKPLLKDQILDAKKTGDLWVMQGFGRETFEICVSALNSVALIVSHPSLPKDATFFEENVTLIDFEASRYRGYTWAYNLVEPLLPTENVSLKNLRPSLNPNIFRHSKSGADNCEVTGNFTFVNMLSATKSNQFDEGVAQKFLCHLACNTTEREIVVNSGSKSSDYKYATKITKKCPSNVRLLSQMTLRKLLCLLDAETCRKIITVDTSIAHITAAWRFRNKEVVVIFRSEKKKNEWFFKGFNTKRTAVVVKTDQCDNIGEKLAALAAQADNQNSMSNQCGITTT